MNIRRILLFWLMGLLFACSGPQQQPNAGKQAEKQEKKSGESELLIDYLAEGGDYVNSRKFPSMIKAPTVYEDLDRNNLYIDMRHPDYFRKGHIEGAVNVRFADIPEYFQSGIVPFEYDKIILICYGGQISSYTTSLLRLMGYGNVYSMRWGMSAWNKAFAENFWLKAVSSKYEDQLETEVYLAGAPGTLPELHTGKLSGEEILMERYRQLFGEDLKEFQITADEVFANPDKYYIINFDRKDKYEAGHIPGAIRYKPNATLGILSAMETIPTDKEVVVYCGTGHNSSFATAYLRLIGYRAHTLEHGNNAFMHSKMLREKADLSWIPFTAKDINDYPFVKE